VDRTPVIVGTGLSDYPKAPDLDGVQHHVQAFQRALADSGLEKSEINGYVSAGGGGIMVDDAVTMAEYLRIDHRYIDGTMTGGSSFEFHVQHLAAAIREGLCDVQYEAPYGNSLVGAYAMHAARHMHEFGTTPAQLAEIAVGVREFATLNPHAIYRDPITADDVLNSRMIADPLHKLDCCSITDGGGAILITTADRAKDLRQPPVYVLGAAGAETHWNVSQQPDFTTCAGALAGPIAFERAGLTPKDVDVLQFYDSFTITCLILLESLGFAPRGEGGPFVEEGNLKRGGRFPLNTDGGGLSSSHPGMRGIFLLIEAARQLRGQAGEGQVPNCRTAICAGSGGWLSAIGVAILGAEHP